MKPKPLASLNHFTFPLAIDVLLLVYVPRHCAWRDELEEVRGAYIGAK
jgi:hypothetical protein